MSLDADLDVILAGGEDTFTAGQVTVTCSLLEQDNVMGAQGGDAGVICGSGSVLVRASLFPDLATGDAVTLNKDRLDEQRFRVVQKMRVQDGKVLQVYLGDANG